MTVTFSKEDRNEVVEILRNMKVFVSESTIESVFDTMRDELQDHFSETVRHTVGGTHYVR